MLNDGIWQSCLGASNKLIIDSGTRTRNGVAKAASPSRNSVKDCNTNWITALTASSIEHPVTYNVERTIPSQV